MGHLVGVQEPAKTAGLRGARVGMSQAGGLEPGSRRKACGLPGQPGSWGFGAPGFLAVLSRPRERARVPHALEVRVGLDSGQERSPQAQREGRACLRGGVVLEEARVTLSPRSS